MVTRNVVCMKWGTVYGPEYVNILHHMVQRNLTGPYRFICLTDNPAGLEEGIETFSIPPLQEPRPEYYKCHTWRKLLLFDQPLFDLAGKVLFLDLDVVIVGKLDGFFTFSEKMAIIENWSQPNRLIGQASAFCFTIGQYRHLLEQYRADPDGVAKKHRTEQVYITRALGQGNFDFFPDPWCRSFKFHCLPGGFRNSLIASQGFPEQASIIVFHGNPNPPDAIAGVWGKPVPWYKKFYKSIKPASWVADYWY